MVPPLSALSLALCREALEGGGNQKIEKCAGTPALERANRAINMHSRGPTEP